MTDAIICLGTTEVCQDEGGKETLMGLMVIPCLCACPSAAKMGEVGDEPTADQCKAMTRMKGAADCEVVMKTITPEDKAKVDKCPEPKATADGAPIQNAAFVAMVMSVTAFLI